MKFAKPSSSVPAPCNPALKDFAWSCRDAQHGGYLLICKFRFYSITNLSGSQVLVQRETAGNFEVADQSWANTVMEAKQIENLM
jgi:hypothetical protein